jgi:hypothetical protein|tara:strand:- start:187 stop:2361 length:2175 start_codon:yes stop_codon:yes gene_type:complete
MATEKHPEVKKSERLLDNYHEGRATWATQAMEDDEFRNNQQWKTSHKNVLSKRSQVAIVDNIIYPAVEQAKALLTANKPKFQSAGRDDSDNKVGRIFSDIMAYIWDISNGSVELKQVVDDYYVKGMGVMQAYVDGMADFGKGEIKIKNIDPLDFYLDPNSKDPFARDSACMIIAKRITDEQIKTVFPTVADKMDQMTTCSGNNRYPTTMRDGSEDQQIGPTEDSDGYYKHYEIIDRYEKVKLPYFHILDSLTGEENIMNEKGFEEFAQEPAMFMETVEGVKPVTEDRAVMELLQIYESTGGVYHMMQDPVTGQPTIMPGEEHEGAIPGSTTRLTPVTNTEMIDEGVIVLNQVIVDRIKRVLSIGGLLVDHSIMDIDDYPIVPLMNRHNRNPYPMSDVRFVKPIQEYINKLTSLIIAHASSSTNTKLLIPRGSMDRKQLEEEWSRAGTGVIEYDPELGQPIVAGPIPLPNELYRNKEDAKTSIYQILGIHPLSQGDPSAAPQTYKGTVAIDEYAQRRIKSKLDDIDEMLNQVGRIVVQLIQQTYTDEKVIKLMQPDGRTSEALLNRPVFDDFTGEIVGRINDITIGKYDLIVVSGSTLPSNRWARFDYYMTLYEKGIIDQVEVLQQTEVADTEGVLERTAIIGQQQQMISQLQEELKKIKGDLQTSERESVHDKKRVEIEKFKRQLGRANDKTAKAVELFEARLNDQLKIERETEAENQTPVAVS